MTSLTKTRLMMGVNYIKSIALKSYGGAEVKVRPVSDVGLAEIQSRIGYGLFDAIRDFSNMGMSDAEMKALMENDKDIDVDKLASLNIPPKLTDYMIELCKKGMVPTPDPECPKCHGKPTGICPECDTRNEIDNLIGFSTFEIGAVVLEMSMANWEDIESFFSQQKAASGPEPSPKQD